MCISKIGKIQFRIQKNKNGYYYGWKVFRIVGEKYYAEFCGTKTPRPIKKWLKAKSFAGYYPSVTPIDEYKPGWHVFRTKKDATSWELGEYLKVVKVLARKTREKGCMKDGINCFIADEIFIPK